MTVERLRALFLVNAVYSVAVGALLLAGSWDGLWDALDLPQGQPALFVQIGGALLWGIAYLFWLAARTPSLMLPVARASALMDGLSVVVIVVWLVSGRLDIGTLGTVLLIFAAALGAVFTVLKLMAGIRPGGYGPEPPPPPPARTEGQIIGEAK